MSRTKTTKKFAALKTGLYARFFDDLEASELAQMSEDIDDEIKALRVAAGRLFGRASEEARDWESEMHLLEAFGRQCLAVAALVRTKKFVGTMSGDAAEAIRLGLLMAGEEWEPFKERK